MGLIPTPDTSSVTITYWYVKAPPSLTSGGAIVIPAGWEYLIGDWAIIKCLTSDKKFNTRDRVEAKFKSELREFEIAMRNYDGSTRPRMKPATPEAMSRHFSISSK